MVNLYIKIFTRILFQNTFKHILDPNSSIILLFPQEPTKIRYIKHIKNIAKTFRSRVIIFMSLDLRF